MSAVDLLEFWASRGVEFGVDGNDVVFDVPFDVDVDELIAAITPRKAAVIAYLQGRDSDSSNAGDSATAAVVEPVRDDAAVATGEVRSERPAAVGVCAEEAEGISTWDDGEPWTEQTKSCPRCRSAATWVSMAGVTRCTRCNPPERSRQILETAKQFRRRLGIAPPLGALVLLGAMRGRRNWRPPVATVAPNRINKPR